MRKIITSNLVSLDGYMAGLNGELDWHVVDNEFFAYAENMLNSVDCILFGRVTYQMMASFWPTETAKTNDPVIAGKMNALQKIVFSTTLDGVEWENTILIKENIRDTIIKLKEQPGKDIVILGSGEIVSLLTELELIDEYRFIINPVILGKGKPQFTGNINKKTLKINNIKQLGAGVVMLTYQPIQ